MNNERKEARRRFAVAVKAKIAESMLEIERELWIEAAKAAKEEGLYAPSTFVGDVERGLRSYANMERYLVKKTLEAVGVIAEPKASSLESAHDWLPERNPQ